MNPDPKLISVCREQRQKEASKAVVVNSFPKDRDYRQEAMQAAAANAVSAMSKHLTSFNLKQRGDHYFRNVSVNPLLVFLITKATLFSIQYVLKLLIL